MILINNDDCEFTNDYFREERVRKNKEIPTNKIKTFNEINDIYEGENISQKNSRVVEKDFSSGINKCCENGDRYNRDRHVKIFSEMGDNVVFRCEENCVEDIIENDVDENYVEFNCRKFYVSSNKNKELSKKPCENVSEEEDLITIENEHFSENFNECNVLSKKEVIFENNVNCKMSKNEVSNIERELFKEKIINVYDNIECLGNNENKSLCENKVRGEKFGSFEINENKSLCENNVDFVDSENKSLCEDNVDFVDSENKCLCEVQCEIIEGFGIEKNKGLNENKVRCEHSKSFGINEISLCEKNYYDVIDADKTFGNVSCKNEKFNVEKNNENEAFCGELNDEKLFSESDENMGYKELSHNYLEIYEKPYLSEIQDEQIIQMHLENILDERNKTQCPREKETIPMGCVDLVFDGMQQKEIFLFLDDAVIYGEIIAEHNEKFERFLQRLRKANLKLQPDKCEFLKTEVVYLGHVLSEEGVKPVPRKLEAVRVFPQSKNIKNIRQFLGLAGYYRRFIHNFSGIAKPLSNLLKNDTPSTWSDETQKVFDILKDKLCTQPVLKIADFSLPFILICDASGVAIGGILSQGQINKDRPIAYASRVLSDTERKYDTYSREALAIVYSVNQFRPYLLG